MQMNTTHKKLALKNIIPRKVRSIIRRIYFDVLDITDTLTFRRKRLTPPRRLIFVGDGNFNKVGQEFLTYFRTLGGLKPDHRVLDVGCGIGRMAVPLTEYLTASGKYEGFDIVKGGIEWCQKKITPQYTHFHFHHADVYNKEYNPNGRFKASEYRFPYGDSSFDFIFLTSVFTHMLPDDLEHYMSEISRVMRPDAKCLITFFLLNEESISLIEAGRSTLPFSSAGNYWTTNPEIPESAVAYDEKFIQALYGKYSLSIGEPIHYGSWCGRKKFFSYQDIVIGVKR